MASADDWNRIQVVETFLNRFDEGLKNICGDGIAQGKFHFLWIDESIFVFQSEVQMGAGCSACHAHIAYGLFLVDLVSYFQLLWEAV